MASTISSPDNTIWSAAYVGDLAAVKAHIEQGGQGPDVKDPLQGSTALHWAAFGGHLGLVRWLVKDAGRSVTVLRCTHTYSASQLAMQRSFETASMRSIEVLRAH
jgi:Ankyrin repeats (many copies)